MLHLKVDPINFL